MADTSSEEAARSALINAIDEDHSVKPMSPSTEKFTAFSHDLSVGNDDFSSSSRLGKSPSETMRTAGMSFCFEGDSPFSAFEKASLEQELANVTDPVDSPWNLFEEPPSDRDVANVPHLLDASTVSTKRDSSTSISSKISSKKTKKRASNASVSSTSETLKSSASKKRTSGSKKKVKKRVPDPPDMSKYLGDEGITVSTLQQRKKNRSSKWQKSESKKVKKTFPDSVEASTGCVPPSRGMRNSDVWDIEAVKTLVENAQASIDPSVTLSLERTLYAALQHSWLLALGGVGLMSVGDGKKIPTNLGVVLVVISMLSIIGALMMHYVRLFQIKSGATFKFWQTALFTSFITLCILLTLSLELYFGILYPYLLRTKSVAIDEEP